LTVSGAVIGGNAGTAGTGPNGNGGDGAGGVGIVGQNLNLTISGTGSVAGGSGANAITFTAGTNSLEIQSGSTITGNVVGTGGDTFKLGGSTNGSFAVSGIGSQYTGFNTFQKTGTSTWTLTGTTVSSSPWAINQGTLSVSADNNLGAATGGVTLNGGTLQSTATFSTARTVNFASASSIDVTGANNLTLTGSLTGTGLTKTNTGTLTLNGTGYAGTITIASGGGTLALSGAGSVSTPSSLAIYNGATFDISGLTNGGTSIGSLSGAGTGTVNLGANTLTITNANGTFAGAITDGGAGGSLALTGGKEILTGTSTYTGATTISNGTLEVDGAITSTSSVTVGAGGTLTGTGIIDPLTVTFASGSTFAPGTTPGTFMTIGGNLVLAPGATYAVSLNPSNTTYAVINGTATLTGAAVKAFFASGSYVSKQYAILTTTGGLGGTTFASLTNTNLPAGASDSLSYSADDVYLNLKAGFTTYTGLNTNQQNVANTLTNYFNTTGGIPGAFFGLSPNGLTRIDGEAATDAAQGAFLLMDQFLELMLDPFVDGRGGGNFQSGGGGAYGFAPEQQTSFPPDVALAYDAVLKAPPATAFDRRWTTWGAAFGGSNTTAGDATFGSHDSTAQIYGYAAGMDYHYAKDSVVGFALAGGGTNWGLSQGLGGGRSDAFQAGLYSATHWGPAYVAAALDASNYWMSTSRAALAGDQLNATFMAQGYGVRAEAGYRFAAPLPGAPFLGVTPYGALRGLSFHSPSYSEADPSGGGFGLSYNATTATDTRSELGARFDDPTIVAGMPLVLRGRLAWAHDWASDPAINATFETLPGASFTVNGARIPQDSALVSGGAQLFVTSRWSLLARAEGQFAPGSQTYAGSGTLRYSW
jgi:autotransporter-associated beta strand protein